MFANWDQLLSFYKELELKVTSGNVSSKERAQVQKDLAAASELLQTHKEIQELYDQVQEAQGQLSTEQDQELKDMFEAEITDLQSQISLKEGELEDLMYPVDDIGARAAYLEIRAGTGGQEAALFVGDLLKMYLLYAERQNWKTNIVSESQTDIGGYKEVVVHIKGKNVYGALKQESGAHRVQRVPQTETSGRVHTSTATVAVMPEAEDVDVQINENDLRIDVFRASGAGGQHVNTTDSAVRITHIPSGAVVSCQDERSQHKNKAKAMKMLKSRILAHAEEQRKLKESKNRKEQVGTGERSEKIRTYNYPQNRVTDHQVNLTLKTLEFIMQGDLGEIIQALLEQDRKTRQLHPVLQRL